MNDIVFLFSGESVPSLAESPFESHESVPVFDNFELINREIDGLLALQENWDGQGAIRVMPDVADTAKRLFAIVNFVDGTSDIFANPHGTITIEWTNRKKEKLSLEIGANTYSYFVKYLDNKPKFVDGQNILMDAQTLTKDLGELFSEEILNFIQ